MRIDEEMLLERQYQMEEEMKSYKSLDLRIIKNAPGYGDIVIYNHSKRMTMYLGQDFS
jgi:hypothetical protein